MDPRNPAHVLEVTNQGPGHHVLLPARDLVELGLAEGLEVVRAAPEAAARRKEPRAREGQLLPQIDAVEDVELVDVRHRERARNPGVGHRNPLDKRLLQAAVPQLLGVPAKRRNGLRPAPALRVQRRRRLVEVQDRRALGIVLDLRRVQDANQQLRLAEDRKARGRRRPGGEGPERIHHPVHHLRVELEVRRRERLAHRVVVELHSAPEIRQSDLGGALDEVGDQGRARLLEAGVRRHQLRRRGQANLPLKPLRRREPHLPKLELERNLHAMEQLRKEGQAVARELPGDHGTVLVGARRQQEETQDELGEVLALEVLVLRVRGETETEIAGAKIPQVAAQTPARGAVIRVRLAVGVEGHGEELPSLRGQLALQQVRHQRPHRRGDGRLVP